MSPAPLMTPKLSLSHDTAEPATATEPSSAYTGGCPSSWYASVVSSLLALGAFVPAFISRKQPVPYVFFASPGEKQACPNSAACWSPRMPATRTPGSTESAAHSPSTPLLGATAGSMRGGTRNAAHSAGSHCRLWMLNSSVRDALVTSVTCSGGGAPAPRPRVRRHTMNESIVPARAVPASAAARRPGTLSRHHASLEAVK